MGKLKFPLPRKYLYRREQLLHYLIYAGEIPTDLYKVMGISSTNFRMYISRLRQEEIIRTNRTDNIVGYVLTTKGRRMVLEDIAYKKYGGKILPSTNDVQKRRRMRNFAAAFAMFDITGITYEDYLKPNLSGMVLNKIGNELYFYSANEFKKTQRENGITIKGSKSYGLLVGNNQVIPIYKAKYELPEFFSIEFNYIQLLKKHFKTDSVYKAVILCENLYACENISRTFLNFENTNKGKDITEAGYYTDLCLIPITEHTQLHIWTLYNEEQIRNLIKQQYGVEEKVSYIINDGFISEKPLLFLLNLNIARLRPFLAYNKHSKGLGYIVCYDFMSEIIKHLLSENNHIKIIAVKSEDIERRCVNNA